jgi:hypothetical protein
MLIATASIASRSTSRPLTCFTLSEAELELVQTHRGEHNRLGFALQLVALKLLGFAPDDLSTAPARAIAYLALQLGVPTLALAQYGDREHTRTDHLREIEAYLGFRDARPADFEALLAWLVERALEHDRPLTLLHITCEWLRQEKIVRQASLVWMDRLDRGLPTNDQLRLVGDDLTISPVRGEDLPETVEQLQEHVAERLAKLELAICLLRSTPGPASRFGSSTRAAPSHAPRTC